MVSLLLLLMIGVWPVPAAGAAPLQPQRTCLQSHFLSPESPTVGPCPTPATTAAPAATTLPGRFQESIALGGLNQPTAIRFSPDGRVFVAEKSGLILVYDSLDAPAPKVFADLRTNVYSYWDRGLLGLALDPAFPTKPYVYVLYTYDAPPGGAAPTWGDGCPTPPGPTTDGCVASGRLSRLTASGDAMTGAEQVLVQGWCEQFPSHAVDELRFGPDGALYATAGESASFNYADYGQRGNPCGDPPVPAGTDQTPPGAEGGALRAQSALRPAGQPVALNGALLRLDPATGDGMPDNPLASSADPNARRILAYGLRNPFRFTFRPGTGEAWIGNVGWNTWEAIDRVTTPYGSATNFGWPCYEGPGPQPAYQSVGLNVCNSLYSRPGAVTAPYYTYNHGAHVVANDNCPTGSSAVTGLAFYTGTSYPAAYRNALFFADFSRNCIWAMLPGANGLPDPGHIVPFAVGAADPVDLETDPTSGDLFYVDTNGGTVRRIRYYAGDLPPVPAIGANTTSGGVPLTVAFSSAGTYDPDAGDTITYAWDLNGDGVFGDATTPSPTFTYTTRGRYLVRLKVTDNHGLSSVSGPLVIDVGVSPPVPTISAPASSLTWSVGDTIAFSGSATDAQDGPLPDAALTWVLIMHHCPSGTTSCHTHTIQNFTGVSSGSFVAPDHDYPSYLELRLIASDSLGLQATASVTLYPKTAKLTLTSAPSGLTLTAGATTATTPFTVTVINGTTTTISAPQSQGAQLSAYDFASWSDGGAATHTVAVTGDASYAATYTQRQGAKQWYFAEGYTGTSGGDFSTLIALANPNSTPAHVTIAYHLSAAPWVVTHTGITMAPYARFTDNVNNFLAANANNNNGGAGYGVATVVSADVPIVAERPMYFTYDRSGVPTPTGFDVMGATQLSSTFAFDDLDAHSDHLTLLTILNPTDQTMYATLTLYPAGGGAPLTAQQAVPAQARGALDVGQAVAAAASKEYALGLYSGIVTLSADTAGAQPVNGLVERPMYWTNPATGYRQGECVMGLPTLQTTWNFAEGWTSLGGTNQGIFHETLYLAYPAAASGPLAHLTVTAYREGGGAPISTTLQLPAGQLKTVDVNALLPAGYARGNSIRVTSDQPILAERLMVWNYGATDVMGSQRTDVVSYFAEGYTGPDKGGFTEILTLENPNPAAAHVTITYLRANDADPSSVPAPVTMTWTIPANARSGFQVNPYMPNQGFSTVLTSDQPILAERIMYFQWGGTDAAGYQP